MKNTAGLFLKKNRSMLGRTRVPKPHNAERDAKVINLYNQGMKIKQIMQEANVAEGTVFRILMIHNIPRRDNKHFNQSKINEAIRMYADASNSILHILEVTGIKSEQTLYRYLKESGVERRRNMG